MNPEKAMMRLSNPKQYKALSEMSDEDLMIQLQEGSIDSFDILVSRYSDRLSTFLFRIVGDAELSADLLQETYMRVFRNRHSYRNIAKFSTWMYTIARNLAFSEYRKGKSRHVRNLHEISRDQEEITFDIADDTNSPEDHTEYVIQERHLQVALEQLPEQFREVVVLCDIQQLTYDEIAEITALPLGTVKSRIHRGRVALQRMLQDVYTSEAAG